MNLLAQLLMATAAIAAMMGALPGIFTMVIYAVVFLLILSLLYFAINRLAPEPVKSWAITIVIVAAGLIVVYALLMLAGDGGGLKP